MITDLTRSIAQWKLRDNLFYRSQFSIDSGPNPVGQLKNLNDNLNASLIEKPVRRPQA